MAAVSTVIVPEGYGLVIAAVFAMSFTYIITSMSVAPTRKRLFNKDFLNKHFGEQHKKEIGGEIAKDGYPDMGNGRYAEKLTYKQWYEFNNAQRAHYNFLEQIVGLIPVALIAGLTFPMATAGITAAYTAGRIVYTVGYIAGGPTARIPGAATNFFGLLGLVVLGGISSYQLALKL